VQLQLPLRCKSVDGLWCRIVHLRRQPCSLAEGAWRWGRSGAVLDRYSTMGLGVEKFESWDKMDSPGWAPSSVPYVLEEFIQSSEYEVRVPVALRSCMGCASGPQLVTSRARARCRPPSGTE
jgi:hypothetical protein